MEMTMNKALPVPFLFVVLALACPLATAEGDAPSCDTIREMLAAGSSADDVIAATMALDLSRAAATVFAVGCVGEDNPEAVAAVGVTTADNLAEAQSVADAVKASAGDNAVVINAVNFALRDYIQHMPQPEVYQDQYTPAGRGRSDSGPVSPAE
jgi:hypothetical protein